LFSDSKVIFSVYDDAFPEILHSDFTKKLKYDKLKDADIKHFKNCSYDILVKNAMDYSDAVILGSEQLDESILTHARSLKIPLLEYQPVENFIETYNSFYHELLKDKEE
jgi:starch synthase